MILPPLKSLSVHLLAAATLLAAPLSAATLVYVGNADSNDIHILRLDDASGELTLVEKVPIPGIATPGASTPMAVSPDHRTLYVGTRGEPKLVAGFAIDQASGRLTYVASGPLADSMAYLATDRTGRFLLGASYPGHKLTVNPIATPGTVLAPQQILTGYPNAHSIVPDASNRHVLAPTLGNDRVNQFAFDPATGRLTPNTPPAVELPAKSGPRHLVYSADERFVYLVSELDGGVRVFGYDTRSGLLSLKQTTSALPPGFKGAPAAADIHLTPDGRFLYASERTSSTLAGFQVDAHDGTLTSVGNWPTEDHPRGFNIDPSGRFLLAAGQLSHALSCYRIDAASGKLTLLKSYPMGKNPNWVEILKLP